MVNRSSLDRIKEFIETNGLKPMKPWSKRYNFSTKDHFSRNTLLLIKKIRPILNILSGDTEGKEIVSMLKC
jgi:hypothetical protein